MRCEDRLSPRDLLTLARLLETEVTPEPNTGCWLWAASVNTPGYGHSMPSGLTVQMHRMAWRLEHGPIPVGMCVLHRCDQRSCVNVAHLFLGTNDDNIRDRNRKGRQAIGTKCHNVYPIPCGEGNHQSKLSSAQVVEIRGLHASGVGTRLLGRRFDVDATTISKIIHRQTWRHLG